jgi:hypothetical protein
MEKKTPHNSKIAIMMGTGLDSQIEGVERIWGEQMRLAQKT